MTKIPSRHATHRPAVRQSGLSMIELLVALAIGSFLIIGAVTLQSQTRRTFDVNEQEARLQENARFVLALIEPDLQLAGLYGYSQDPNVVQWDGGTLIPLPKDKAYMAELGYLIGPIRLSPIVRFERLVAPLIENTADPTMPPQIPNPTNPSEDRFGGGLAFWPYGHNSNLKVFFTRVHRNVGLHDFNVISAQWQVHYF